MTPIHYECTQCGSVYGEKPEKCLYRYKDKPCRCEELKEVYEGDLDD